MDRGLVIDVTLTKSVTQDYDSAIERAKSTYPPSLRFIRLSADFVAKVSWDRPRTVIPLC
jgi:hypothetical protein